MLLTNIYPKWNTEISYFACSHNPKTSYFTRLWL
jgi:hypothetical protein